MLQNTQLKSYSTQFSAG